jgi:acetyl-CoA C-acetyltransferase
VTTASGIPATLDDRTPVLVGVGVADQRFEDARAAAEPIALMFDALRAAEADAGVAGLLAGANSVFVSRGFWAYSDPGRLLADRIEAKSARTVLAEIGVLQQTLLNDACNAIASGREQIAIVTGGETKFRSLRANIAGIEISDTQQVDVKPDVVLEPALSLWSDVESERGLMMPAQFFTIMESALRADAGLGLDAHRDRIAALWAAMSEVAAGNPHARHRTPVEAAAIRDPSSGNPMIAFPYTKLHNSDWNVDQAAGLIFCSLAKARELGIAEDRFVFPLAGTESNQMLDVAARAQLHRCPAIEIAGRRALELAGCGIDDIEHVDLYSCFPAAVQMFARELGLSLDRPLTVTGGMRFAGGPLNNYVFQALVRMAELLRAEPGSRGLVTTVSGFLTKQGISLWSTAPGRNGWQYEDVTAEVTAATATRELVGGYTGPATIAGYTVLYLGEHPAKGVAVCDLPDGRRTVAETSDAALARRMTVEEFVGRRVEIAPGSIMRPV